MSYITWKQDEGWCARTGSATTMGSGSTVDFGGISFPSNTTAVSTVIAHWQGGATNSYSTGGTRKIALQIKVNGSWEQIWEGEVNLTGYGAKTYNNVNMNPPSNFSTELSNAIVNAGEIQAIRIQNTGNDRMRISTASLHVWVTYSQFYTSSISQDPTLTVSPNTGASISLSWTSAEVNNYQNCYLKYQVYVTNDKTGYTDSDGNYVTYDSTNGAHVTRNYIGTYSQTSLTISETALLSHVRHKLGVDSTYGKNKSGETLYISVRAYIVDYSTESDYENQTNPRGSFAKTLNPGWSDFTYFPSIPAPLNVVFSPTKGKSFTVQWQNATTGNGDDVDGTYFHRLTNDGWIDCTGADENLVDENEYTYRIPSDVAEGNCTFRLFHTYNERTGEAASFIFVVTGENTIAVYQNGAWHHCVPYVYENGAWHACDPYVYTSGQWVLCSSS